LSILATRATNLGVDLRTLDVGDLTGFDDANIRIRQLHAEAFATNVDVGRNKYIWLGTHAVFDTFALQIRGDPGWLDLVLLPMDDLWRPTPVQRRRGRATDL
jgi:anthraniloyl-CoA monooxygenase